ncbi:MAG: hypothetical protein KatS3mg111_3606 [Pirellulaceae bacterium]|nr:MAG: hypothetical protein KatS3mg111_3606 [Pirellulaceae bacterium]
MTLKQSCGFTLVLLMTVVAGGCNANRLGTVPVTGQVLVDEKPMEGVAVIFNPVDPNGRAASGITDAEGKFTLTTEVNGDGALPGAYKVAVSKYESTGEEALPKEVDMNDEASLDAIYSKLDTMKPVEHQPLIDPMYGNANGSGLTAEVTADGENHFVFSVTGPKR